MQLQSESSLIIAAAVMTDAAVILVDAVMPQLQSKSSLMQLSCCPMITDKQQSSESLMQQSLLLP